VLVPSLVLILWIPFCTALFTVLRPVRAVVLAYLMGWLFLPMYKIQIQGFWDIDKVLATNIGVMLGVLLFCSKQFRRFRLQVADVLLIVFALGACATSVVNGLGIYDGISSMTHKLFLYAIPFLIGRLFLTTRRDLYDASHVIVCVAALYALLAVWEWRMSPQLHETVYGYAQHALITQRRWGFFRSVVFFPMTLGLGTFFAWTTLLGGWLWYAKKARPILGIPPIFIVILPLVGLFTTMSYGPYGMFLVGLSLLVFWQWQGWRGAVWVPVVFALLWMTGRYTHLTDGRWLTAGVSMLSQERADSLQYRIDAETALLEHAKRRPVLGWGTWGRNRVVDNEGRDRVATDGLWVILVSSFGLVGLASFFLWWCWPVVMSGFLDKDLRQDPVILAMLIVIGMQAVNCLFNAFHSPVLTLMCGGLVTCLATMQAEKPRNKIRWIFA